MKMTRLTLIFFVSMGLFVSMVSVSSSASTLLAPSIAAPKKPITPAEKERARNYFTDTLLTTQKGETVKFYSDTLDGHVVAVNVMYTSCEGACPLLTQMLTQVRRELGDQFGDDIRFVSISNDPVRDTPEALTEFARKQGANEKGWTFLTGNKLDVDRVISKLGLYTKNFEEHLSMILIGNTRTGHWKKIQPNTPYQAIVLQLKELANEG